MNAASLHVLVLLLGAPALATLLHLALGIRPTLSPSLGHRGLERAKAIGRGGAFATFEPVIRYIAALMARMPLDRTRTRLEGLLRHADHHLGLDPNELLALSTLSALGLGTSVTGIASAAGYSPTVGLFGLMLGAILPTMQLQEISRARIKTVSRGLPHAIEIAAMCMSAGLDFPGALRMLVGRGERDQNALSREFSVILEQLDLGRTRRQALLDFADRVPTSAVRDFVNAVIQSEQKGNPLARVLQVQGRVLNTRRSVAAEEAAARAGVMMLVPMMLLVGCIMILLMGPFVISGVGF